MDVMCCEPRGVHVFAPRAAMRRYLAVKRCALEPRRQRSSALYAAPTPSSQNADADQICPIAAANLARIWRPAHGKHSRNAPGRIFLACSNHFPISVWRPVRWGAQSGEHFPSTPGGPSLPDFGPYVFGNRARLGRFRANLGRKWPALGPIWWKLGQLWAKSSHGLVVPKPFFNLGRVRAHFGRLWRESG